MFEDILGHQTIKEDVEQQSEEKEEKCDCEEPCPECTCSGCNSVNICGN